MLTNTLSNTDFYHIFWYFLCYSFLGWLWEVFYVYLRTDKLVNRGFLNGPFCPIYGFGASFIYLFLTPFKQNDTAIFFGGMILATVLEYFTATAMEMLFHAKWWDYSDRKLNIKGRICLQVSIGWGFLSVIMMKVLHPTIIDIISIIPYSVGYVLMYVIVLYFVVDTTATVRSVFKLNEALAKIQSARDELRERIESTKLYIAREELLDKLEESQEIFENAVRSKLTTVDAKYAFLKEELASANVEFQDEIKDRFNEFTGNAFADKTEDIANNFNSYKEEIKSHVDEFKEKWYAGAEEIKKRHLKYMNSINELSSFQKRIIKAFPEMQSKDYKDVLEELKTKLSNKKSKKDEEK